jgi:folate-dependent phosphoribosylglycinamide formyltransferase PurN
MRIVMFARVPRWYSFKQDRLAKRLQAEGHETIGIVVEQTKTLASLREWRHKYGPHVMMRKIASKLVRQAGMTSSSQQQNANPADKLPRCDAPVYFVASHNSDECVEVVKRLQPEVIVLRGCGIVKKQVLAVPTLGTINPHYAVLPAYRGMEVTEWSALHGDPCAVSVHWVAEAVDAGGVITSRPINVERGDDIGNLREKAAVIAAELLAEALNKIQSGVARPGFVPIVKGRQYFVMHPRLRKLAEMRLR